MLANTVSTWQIDQWTKNIVQTSIYYGPQGDTRFRLGVQLLIAFLKSLAIDHWNSKIWVGKIENIVSLSSTATVSLDRLTCNFSRKSLDGRRWNYQKAKPVGKESLAERNLETWLHCLLSPGSPWCVRNDLDNHLEDGDDCETRCGTFDLQNPSQRCRSFSNIWNL